MKPRIFKALGLWLCAHEDTYHGIGYTPKQAYADWLNMQAKHAHRVCA